MKDASFRHTLSDLQTPLFHRSYNSRSLYNGYFGFGWCSTFEKSLKINNTELVLKDCKYDTEILFKLYSKNIFRSVLNKKDTIEFKNGVYTRQYDVYDKWGRYVVSSGSGTSVRLFYEESGRLDRGVLPDGRILQFFWDLDKIKQVKLGSEVINYTFEASNLISVTKNTSTYKYTYDQLNNLISITFPNRKQQFISYDSKYDWVTRIQNECVENYSYFTRTEKEFQHQTATVTKSCPQRGPMRTQYEYWFSDNRLSRTKVSNEFSSIDIHFDPEGNPIKSNKNQISVTSRYLSTLKSNGGTQ